MENRQDKILSPVLVYKNRDEMVPYQKIVVPSSMRSPYWKFFGFPADKFNNIITRTKIICCICRAYISYNKNTTNLSTHLNAKHADILTNCLAVGTKVKREKSAVMNSFVLSEKRLKTDDSMNNGDSWSEQENKNRKLKVEHPTGISIKEVISQGNESDASGNESESAELEQRCLSQTCTLNSQMTSKSVSNQFNDNIKYIITTNEDELIESINSCYNNKNLIELINDDSEIITDTQSLSDETHPNPLNLTEEYLTTISTVDDETPNEAIDYEIDTEQSNSYKGQDVEMSLEELERPSGSHRHKRQTNTTAVKVYSSNYSNIIDEVKSFLIKDLMRPSVINGSGFQQLVQNLSNSSFVPDVSQMEQLLETEYKTEHDKMKSLIRQIASENHFSLSIDRWACDSNIALYVNFLTDGVYKKEALNRQIISFENQDFSDILRELNIDLTKCSALVTNFELENDHPLRALCNHKNIPIIESFSSVVANAVTKCLNLPIVQKILRSIEGITKRPLVDCVNTLAYQKFWLTRYNYLVEFIGAHNDSDCDEDDLLTQATAILDCFRPLKNSLDILASENTAWISLMKPLAIQLINQHYTLVDEEVNSDPIELMLNDLKQFIAFDLTEKITKNWFLTIASFLDPRFQSLASTEELHRIRNEIEINFTSDDQNAPASGKCDNSSSKEDNSSRKNGLSSLFVNLPIQKSKTPKNRFEIEFRSYIDTVNVDIEQCPLAWWSESDVPYPNIRRHIHKYFCVPFFVNEYHRLSVDEQLHLYTQRMSIQNDVDSKLLWLHCNNL